MLQVNDVKHLCSGIRRSAENETRSASPQNDTKEVGRLAVGAALLGAGTMALEIAFTRLFSAILFYHYVFLVLAVALLGLGLGAALAALLPERARRFVQYAAGAATLAAVSAVVAVVVSTRVLPVDTPILHGFVVLVPFLYVGMAISLLFVAGPAASARIYGGDLVGAAGGALLGYGLLFLGAPTAILGAAVLLAAGGWVVGSVGATGRGERTVALGLVAIFFVLNATLQPLDVDLLRLAEGKPLGQWLQRREAEVLRSNWDPFGRVDVVRAPDEPLERLVFIDGAAGSALPRYPADPGQEAARLAELGAFPYRVVDAERALVIGSGGGVGVLYALLSGLEAITAVEVSQGVIDAVRAAGDYTGFLYERPEVTVVAEEGRSFLARDSSRYDVIDMSLVVSLATARSGYALAENYLFTKEAMASVLAHLSDGGIAAIRLYDDPTLTRAFLTAAAAIRDSGASDAEAVRHLAVIFNPDEADRAGGAFYPLLLVSKEPMTEPAVTELTSRAESLGFTVMFAPFTHEIGPFGEVATGEATLEAIENDLRGGVFTPPTDARPFFFEMTGGLPGALVDTWIAVGVVSVGVAAALALAAARGGTRRAIGRRSGPALFYFAGLGLAFMLAEIGLLARLTLFIGHPTLALTVVLAALLVAAGLGSLLSGRFATTSLDRVVIFAAMAAAVGSVGIPWLVESFWTDAAQLHLVVRIVLATAAVAPLGVAMGMLFPSGLRLVGGDVALPWAVNGGASVIGSVLAITIAIQVGYPAVSVAAAVVYAALGLGGPALLYGAVPVRFGTSAAAFDHGVGDRVTAAPETHAPETG
jgi:spermidine synthase